MARSSQLLEIATARHRAGDLGAARGIYTEILQESPAHVAALFRSGLLELQDGRATQAVERLQQARDLAPGELRHELGLGQALQAAGRFAAAAAAHRRALLLDARCADAYFGLGVALQSQDDHAAAGDAYERALDLQPEHFAALNNLGICRQRCGRFAAAAAAYRRAVAVRPGEAGAVANLGTVLQALGQCDDAVTLLRSAVELQPGELAHRVNLGIALCRCRDFAAAEDVLRTACALDPHSAEAAFNLATAVQGLGRPTQAVELLHRAVALRPAYADAHINLGNLQKEAGDYAAAAASYEAAVRADPDSIPALNNAACLLRTLGRFDDAENLLRRALTLDPRHAALEDNLASVLKDMGDLDGAVDGYRRALALDPRNAATHSNLAYALAFQCADAQVLRDECARWDRAFGTPAQRFTAHDNERDAERRLRIGYVSPDFREHCQSLFMTPLLAHHDHARFEIHCYSSVARPDAHTHRMACFADVWHDVRHLDDAALARRIHDDRIDILVDLTMHMANGRLQAFARKPAPVQIAWLAYPGTTGLQAMDYRISDPHLDPAGCDAHYSERTLRLPDSFWCYDPLATPPAPGPLPALERGYVTFGCLNNPCKLTPPTLGLWSRVLQAVPDARLRLLAPPGRARARLAARLAGCGIDLGRVQFMPHQPRDAYLLEYRHIDVGLDTLPYNGHTTSLDAAWMGVPTLSRIGTTCAGRAGLSQLAQLDLIDLAAASDDDFIAVAQALCSDLTRLAGLRRGLRSRLEHSALMDAPRFARHLEGLFRDAWRKYCG